MTIDIAIKDEDGLTDRHSFQDDSQFRLLLFDNGGIRFLGGLRAPIKAIRKSLRELAADWAAKQDLSGFVQELRGVLGNWAAKKSNTGAQRFLEANTFRFDPDELLSILADVRSEVEMAFRQDYGGRDGTLVFHVLWEMLLAITLRLKEAMDRPTTVWEFCKAPIEDTESKAILEWLFRGR